MKGGFRAGAQARPSFCQNNMYPNAPGTDHNLKLTALHHLVWFDVTVCYWAIVLVLILAPWWKVIPGPKKLCEIRAKNL